MAGRGWTHLACAVGIAAVLTLPACSDDGGSDDGAPTTAADRPAPTVPADVEPGEGFLVLGDRTFLLAVRACALDPFTDPETGVTIELTLDADDNTGTLIGVSRATVQGELATTTETVSVTEVEGEVLEAQRFERDGVVSDLRDSDSAGPLLAVTGNLVRAGGVFGPPGSTAATPGLVDGSLIARCP